MEYSGQFWVEIFLGKLGSLGPLGFSGLEFLGWNSGTRFRNQLVEQAVLQSPFSKRYRSREN